MQKRLILIRLLAIFRAYLLLIVIAALMLFQLTIITSVFQFEIISNSVSIKFYNIMTDFSEIAFFAISGFLLCCCVWFSCSPIALFYLFVKERVSFFKINNPEFSIRVFKGQRDKNTVDIPGSVDRLYWISRLAGKISKKLNIRTPKIVIDKNRGINAKVLPGFIHPSLIVLSQGLVDKLTPDEVEAVIAHELAHVAMHDTYSMSVTDLLILFTIWTPVYILHLVIDYVFLFKWRDKNIGFIFSLFLVLLCYGFFPLFVLNTINRRYELRADRIAMQSTNLQSFLSALNSVHESQSPVPNPLEWCLKLMPKRLQVFVLRTFLSHPSIPARIEALL